MKNFKEIYQQFLCCVTVVCTLFVNPSISSPFNFPETIEEDGKEIFVPVLNENHTCIPLEECSSLVWLMNETLSLKGISSEDISRVLRSKRCVIDELSSEEEITLNTRVVCPKIHDVSYGSGDDDGEDYEVRTVFDLTRSSVVECSLQIQHADKNEPLGDLQTKSLSGERKKYKNLRRLADRRIVRIAAEGSCCWNTYTRIRLAGEPIFVRPNKELIPEVSIKSAEKVECVE